MDDEDNIRLLRSAEDGARPELSSSEQKDQVQPMPAQARQDVERLASVQARPEVPVFMNKSDGLREVPVFTRSPRTASELEDWPTPALKRNDEGQPEVPVFSRPLGAASPQENSLEVPVFVNRKST